MNWFWKTVAGAGLVGYGIVDLINRENLGLVILGALFFISGVLLMKENLSEIIDKQRRFLKGEGK